MTTPGERPWGEEPPRGYEPPSIEQSHGQQPFAPPGYEPPAPNYPPPYPAAPGYPPPAYPPPAPGYPAAYGVPYVPSYGYGPPRTKTNGMAIGSLVASGVGIPMNFACYSGSIAAIVGIVLGIIALNQIKQSGEEGRGFAIAGIAIGGVVLVFTLFAVILIAANS